MTLRHKLLVIFVAVAVLPLLLIGGLNHLASARALESLLAVQTGELADRLAAEIAGRRERHRSDLGLMAENAETRKLLAAANGGGAPRGSWEASSSTAYLEEAWRVFAPDYHALEIVSASGAPVFRAGERVAAAGPALGAGGRAVPVERVATDPATGRRAGVVRAWLRREAALPGEALEARFGREGSTAVVDRGSGELLYGTAEEAGRAAEEGGRHATAGASRGVARYGGGASPRVATWVTLSDPDWTVVSSASVAEFAGPFARTQRNGLLLLLAVVVTAFTAMVVLVGRATRSLRDLTVAAEEVGRGHFDPALPPEADDEVGRLSRAFRLMVEKLRGMMARIEASREMAVLGEFAAQLSHEIRNPLTSLKLNLQGLERDARARRLPADAARPIEICLREVQRLDQVVRSVLRLGRRDGAPHGPVDPGELVAEAAELVRPRAARQGVELDVTVGASDAVVRGDAAALKGALLNLMLNGIEAMHGGGSLEVRTEGPAGSHAGALRIVVSDTGPGVPAELQDRIFRPYFTTRREGTGLGLAMALQVAREHGGDLALERGDGGATFVLELPVLVREAQPA